MPITLTLRSSETVLFGVGAVATGLLAGVKLAATAHARQLDELYEVNMRADSEIAAMFDEWWRGGVEETMRTTLTKSFRGDPSLTDDVEQTAAIVHEQLSINYTRARAYVRYLKASAIADELPRWTRYMLLTTLKRWRDYAVFDIEDLGLSAQQLAQFHRLT